MNRKKLEKALKLGANIDSDFEKELKDIEERVVDLIKKSSAPNLIMEEIKESILRDTFYVVKEGKYKLSYLKSLRHAC